MNVSICLRRKRLDNIDVRRLHCSSLMGASLGRSTNVVQHLCFGLVIFVGGAVHIHYGIIIDPLRDMVMSGDSSAAYKKGFIIISHVVVGGWNGYGGRKQTCSMVNRFCHSKTRWQGKNQILEQGFHSPDQNPFEVQHAGQTFPPMGTPWLGSEYLVDLVGLPSRVSVVLLGVEAMTHQLCL